MTPKNYDDNNGELLLKFIIAAGILWLADIMYLVLTGKLYHY